MKSVLIPVDAYSSENKLDALKTRNLEDIANMLKRVVLAEGCPKSWQGDNAQELVKGAMAKLAEIAGIDPKACSPYEAQDRREVQSRIAPRETEAGARRSSRRRRVTAF